MNIDIAEKPASHCWVVCMDAFTVNFNSLGEAQAFVSLLKARIAAPHIWPSGAGLANDARLMSDRQTAYADGKCVCVDPVE
jgi:hypothetical protein